MTNLADKKIRFSRHFGALICMLGVGHRAVAEQPIRVSVDWSKTVRILKTSPSVYGVTEPLQRPGSPIREPANAALKGLGADYARYMLYFTHPKLSVAELEPPENGKTSWNFSRMDPLVLDFFKATEGHPVILEFSTVPAWMFKDRKPSAYPADPNQIASFAYPQGTDLADPSGRQLADYYARIASWYTQGGFTDECGVFHKSGYHFTIDYWEVLNEPDLELAISPQRYTRLYDAIVSAVRTVCPRMKFVGLSLAVLQPDFFEYFLNPKNHRAGIPLDMISYHGYAIPGPTEGLDQWQYSAFFDADNLVSSVRFIENIRKRLSPSTRTAMDEVGVIADTDGYNPNIKNPPDLYWNLSGSFYAYLYLKLAELGIDSVNQTQFVGHPGFWPGLTMIDWNNGKPNARYSVLKLLIDSFRVGDVIVATSLADSPYWDPVAVQAYRTSAGQRKLLLVNKRNRSINIDLETRDIGGTTQTVDGNGNAIQSSALNGPSLTLAPFAVSVVTWH